MENPMKMDDLGVPPFTQTPLCMFSLPARDSQFIAMNFTSDSLRTDAAFTDLLSKAPSDGLRATNQSDPNVGML